MKFLLSTNSPDRKHTENIVDEINTALYNRDKTFDGYWNIAKKRVFFICSHAKTNQDIDLK